MKVFKNLGFFIFQNCDANIRVFSDEYEIYNDLETHEFVISYQSVNHSKKEYAKGIIYNNNCENRNSLLRPFLEEFQRKIFLTTF
ncbi:MAG: hypothetical protein LBT10_09245 [Methanobrevibacter sp.]|nr:hypothetical protein [Methanobrevibacter sp.]